MSLRTFASPTTTRLVAYTAVLAALAIALAPISIPVGIARLSPTQHFINVLAAGLVGPWWGLAMAVVVSVVRNVLGLGTLLAFPGSVFGALIAGLLFQATRNTLFAAVGEVVGTGIIGAVVGALIVAPYLMGRDIGLAVLILPFFLSSALGAAVGVLGLRLLRRVGAVA